MSDFDDVFKKSFKKIKNQDLKNRVKKKIPKVLEDPCLGKPMRYERKGTRELYIPPFRLAYAFLEDENKIIFIYLYHKDEQ
ncbi:MAG: mRNA-degrading endonuclease RelE of RelBE toxin-antitoxin system [Candidatus Woesearchaeota archaeon]|jgi:mRNA-degrading endonuclease RelE of RelBE toxin-antitoxin system